MCLPAVLPIIGGVLAGVGGAMKAKAEQASLNAQGAFNDRQAKIERMAGAYKAERTQDQVDRTLGAQRAGFAANGVALSGSPADVIVDSATEGALDVAAIRWNSGLAADNYRYKAKIDRMNASAAGRAAPLAFITPIIGGVSEGIGNMQTSFASGS